MFSDRPFSSGSRQPPDPIDHHLMNVGYYRKHTARDASSLFRVVSEQMFQTQIYHEFVREECVKYIGRNRDLAKKFIDRDLDVYLADLARPRTHGSIAELKIFAHMFQRNVLLFQGLNNGNWLVNEPAFSRSNDYFIVYRAELNHFDTIFEQSYIEDAAFCQALCYEMLYSYVFKLPDVGYAVERMLHDPDGGPPIGGRPRYSDELYNPYPETFVLDDGRAFRLDRPENTSCVLEDYQMCHFHNRNFDEFYANIQQSLCNSPDHRAEEKARRMLQSMLTEPYISCVRQLLQDGITPFPYKVAKALDRNIYRNIEYDTWSENRRERRVRILGHNLQTGSKCLVRVHSAQSLPYTCYIQDIRRNIGKCTVFIEELAERRLVSFAALSTVDILYSTSRSNHHTTRTNRRIEHPNNTIIPIRPTAKKSQQQHSRVFNSTTNHRANETLQYEYTKQTKNVPVDDITTCKAFSALAKMRQSNHTDSKRKFDHDFIEMYDKHTSYASQSPDMAFMSQLTSSSNFRPNFYEVVAAPLILGNTNNNHNNYRSPQSKMSGNGGNKNHSTGLNQNQSKAGSNSKSKLMAAGSSKGSPEINNKSGNGGDHSKLNLSDTFSDLTNSSGYQFDDSGYANQLQRHAPQPPCVYYYYDSPWTDPNVDANYDAHRLAAGGYNCPPRSDRARNYFDGPAGPQFPQSAPFPDFMETPSLMSSSGQPSTPDPNAQFYPYFGPGMMIPVRRRDLLAQTLSVNLDAPPSYDPRGYDIATNDLGTLRFFYNLGHEFYTQLRMHYGMAVVAQLAHHTDKPEQNDTSNGQYHHEGGGFIMHHPEMEAVTQKTGNLKLGSKSSMPGTQAKHDNYNRRGGGKMGYTKRFSNRNGGLGDCDQAIATESDLKGNAIDSLKSTPTSTHPNHKDGMDRTPIETTMHQTMPPSYDTLHTPHRFGSEHPPPLLRTPVPLDSSGAHAQQMSDMPPMAPFIPLPAGPAFQPYMTYYPMEDQPMLMPCPPYPSGTLQPYAPYPGQPSMHGQGPMPGNAFFYAGQPTQQIAMAPQGYWYPPPAIVPISPTINQMPATSPGGDVPRSPTIKSNHQPQPNLDQPTND